MEVQTEHSNQTEQDELLCPEQNQDLGWEGT